MNWIKLTALGAVSCRDDYDCYIVLKAAGGQTCAVRRSISGLGDRALHGKGADSPGGRVLEETVAPEEPSQGCQLWTVSDGHGFQVLRFTDNFKKNNQDLFEDSGD